ncbi:hypothetical protein ACLOJK_028331, partial [Asimina triloba]
FIYNLRRSASTGKSPFEIVLGQQPMTPNEITRERGGGLFLKAPDRVVRGSVSTYWDVMRHDVRWGTQV